MQIQQIVYRINILLFKQQGQDIKCSIVIKHSMGQEVPVENRQSFLSSFLQQLSNRSHNLYTSLITTYQPKNTFPFSAKQKILLFLKYHSLALFKDLDDSEKVRTYGYDIQFYLQQPQTLSQMRDLVLKGTSVISEVESGIKRLRNSEKQMKVRYLNESAYEFDRQRVNGICWGMLTGAIVNSTIYSRGSKTRKLALFLGLTHLAGQVSYHYNMNHYFDNVYEIFEEQSLNYLQKQRIVDEKDKITQSKTSIIDADS